MKTKAIFLLIAVTSVLLVNAQNTSIIVGEYDTTMTYFDIDPDSTVWCMTHPGETREYDIDFNQDGIIDYQLRNNQSSGLGGGGGSISLTPFNQNEVAYDSIYMGKELAQVFYSGEQIDNTLEYTNSIAYLVNYYWDMNPGGDYSINTWIDAENTYLGTRMTINDTIVYGWIKIEVPQNNSFTIEEYALSKVIVYSSVVKIEKEPNIKLYPNPANNLLYIEKQKDIRVFGFEIIDVMGKIHIEKGAVSEEVSSINIANLKEGVYFLRVKFKGEIYTSKFLKK